MANCDNCGHCMDLNTPEENDKPQYVEIRRKTIDWIAKMLK